MYGQRSDRRIGARLATILAAAACAIAVQSRAGAGCANGGRGAPPWPAASRSALEPVATRLRQLVDRTIDNAVSVVAAEASNLARPPTPGPASPGGLRIVLVTPNGQPPTAPTGPSRPRSAH